MVIIIIVAAVVQLVLVLMLFEKLNRIITILEVMNRNLIEIGSKIGGMQ